MVCGLWPADIVIAVRWYCVWFSLHCSACLPSFSLAGTSSLPLLGSAWILNGGWKNHVQILTGPILKTSVFSQLTWKGAIVPVLVDLCQSFKYLGSYMAGSAYSRACRRKYRATKEWKELHMGTAGLLVWVPLSRPIPINPPGLCGSVLVLSKDLGYQKTHSSREKVLLQG